MLGRGGGAGAKTALQEMGPTPNLPRPLRNRALQTIIVLKKWQIRPRPCVNIPAVAEWEYQNPPASAPQPLRACVSVALRGSPTKPGVSGGGCRAGQRPMTNYTHITQHAYRFPATTLLDVCCWNRVEIKSICWPYVHVHFRVSIVAFSFKFHKCLF